MKRPRPPIMLMSTLVLLALAAPARAQSPRTLEPLQDALDEALDDDRIATRVRLRRAIDELGLPDDLDPLSLVDEWSRLLDRRYRSGRERTWGAGRVVDEVLEYDDRGDTVLFEYSYRLPDDYDHRRPWPVVLCLHDDGGDGKRYIESVWTSTAEATTHADEVILVAPHVVDRTPRKRLGRSRRSKAVRLEHLGRYHALCLLLPLIEVQERFHVDASRIFVEGIGQGAKDALELAALYGVEVFAGVVARGGAVLEKPVLAPGLEGVASLGRLTRADGDGRQGDAPAGRDVPVRAGSRPVVEFHRDHVRPAYPASVRLVTDNPIFRKRAWLMVIRHELDAGIPVDVAARLVAEKNRIEIDGKGADAFTVFLNDELLDLDRPVEVVVNGRLVERKTVTRSLDYMLRQMRLLRPGDGDRIYTAFLRVVVPVEDHEE